MNLHKLPKVKKMMSFFSSDQAKVLTVNEIITYLKKFNLFAVQKQLLPTKEKVETAILIIRVCKYFKILTLNINNSSIGLIYVLKIFFDINLNVNNLKLF